MCFDCLSMSLNEQHKVKVKLADHYDAPLHEISKFFTLNQYISGLKLKSKTIKASWIKMSLESKLNILAQLKEQLEFIV